MVQLLLSTTSGNKSSNVDWNIKNVGRFLLFKSTENSLHLVHPVRQTHLLALSIIKSTAFYTQAILQRLSLQRFTVRYVVNLKRYLRRFC